MVKTPQQSSPKPQMRKVPRVDITLNDTEEPKAMQRPYTTKFIGVRAKRIIKENTNFVKLN